MAGRVAEERLIEIEAQLAALEQSVRALDLRLTAVERTASPAATDAAASWTTFARSGEGAEAGHRADARAAAGIAALLGRALLGLAGAYLLRALTESGALAPVVGVTAGLAYALGWLALADRSRGDRLASEFYGGIACLVAFPLAWEAATKFGLLEPASTAALLGAATIVALAVAADRRLPALAWFVALLALGFAVAFIASTDRVVPFATLIIVVGVATLWLGYVRDWVLVRWPVALVADLLVVAATFRVVSGNTHDPAAEVAALALLLPAAYLVNIIARTVGRGRDVIPFEIAQSVAALGIGLGTMTVLARRGSFAVATVGWGALALGGVCYAVAFLFAPGRRARRSNVYFYSAIGLLLALFSIALVSDEPSLPFAALAVAAAIAGGSTAAGFMTLHAVLYALAACVTSGALAAAAPRLIGAAGGWPPFTLPMLIAFAATVGAYAVATRARTTPAIRVQRFVLVLLSVWTAGGFVVDVLSRAAGAAGAAPTGTFDAGTVATIRTVVIAAAAIGAAMAGRARRLEEIGWLVYPLLAAGGAKLLFDDLRQSRPATLFVALALFGAALILAPRLGRPAREVDQSHEGAVASRV